MHICAQAVDVVNVIYLTEGEPRGKDDVVHVEGQELEEREYLLFLRSTLCLEQEDTRD